MSPTKLMRRFAHPGWFARAALALLSAGLLSAPAHSADEAYPTKPIKIIVSWAPGGTTDAAARILAQKLSERLATPVVIDNKPGANGRIGAEIASKALADGYTLFLASAETHSINQHVFKRMPYDPLRDFVGVAGFATNAFAIIAHPDAGIASMKDLVSRAKANPGRLTFASWGVGSTSQLGMEMLKARAGVHMLHIPFLGEAPALTAVMGGQIDLMMVSAQRAEILRKEGKVKVLASTAGKKYFAVPEAATLKESGFDVVATNWFGIAAPTKTPRPILERLAKEVSAAANSAEVMSQLRGLGLDAFPEMSMSQFDKFIREEGVKWGAVIQRANVRLDQ